MFMNFIADETASEMYGVYCVTFDTVSGAEIVSAGSETELVTSKTPRDSAFHITSQEYSKPLSFNMQLINQDESDMDAEKEIALKKWLCKRGKYIDFNIDDERFYNIHFKVNISNPQLIKVGRVVGLQFTVNCKYPFGHSPVATKPYNIASVNQQIKLYVNNDDDDYVYPDVILTANSSGSLSITNSTETSNRVFTINNLVAGEVITIKGSIPDISSSIPTHDIYADFNKHWLRLIDGANTLTISNSCSIKLSYNEARTVGV